MLVVGRDHKLFFPAYNDASNLKAGSALTDDGSLDIHYISDPKFTYYGYFDSGKCYSYDDTNYFTPKITTSDKTCKSSAPWSGDFLNYLTTSRADALRKVLYGGYRSTDKATKNNDGTYTGTTYLERAYIRQDAHVWGKEYLNSDNDGYDISKYTPYTSSSSKRYILFANASTSTNGSPLLRIIADSGPKPNYPTISDNSGTAGDGVVKSSLRIWNWISRESVEGGSTVTTTSSDQKTNKNTEVTPNDYIVRVKVCVPDLLENNCKLYPNGDYKPTGLLHDYGEGNQMYFGLVTGSYTNNLQGGVVRKAMSSFSNEIDPNTGIFGATKSNGGEITSTGKQDLISSLDGIRISDTNNSGSYNSCSGGNALSNGSCINWGNPLSEMMFEALRYYSGESASTTGYSYGASSIDDSLGMKLVSKWTNPYAKDGVSGGTAYSCSKPFMTVLSDVNPNFDSDLPGSPFNQTNPPSASGALTNFDAKSLGDKIWNGENLGSIKINIGEVGGTNDSAPTAKSASSFGNIRGLPEEPAKQGTYYSSAVAYYGNTHSITTTKQSVKTFAVALSSPLPRIQMPVGKSTVTLVPFGKVAYGGNIDATMQIVGFYVQAMYNMPGQTKNPSKNNGYPQAIFRVVFDDAAQGADYDLDMSALYTVSAKSNGTLEVIVKLEYQQAGYESHVGYTIANTSDNTGKSTDGIYLEVSNGYKGGQVTSDKRNYNAYNLDTPPNRAPGFCVNNTSTCQKLTFPTDQGATATRTFYPGNSASTLVTNLQDPLWYAAKWGGFDYSTSSQLPISGKWDSRKAGTPDNYFLVTNATTLKDQMSKAFNQILQSNDSIARPAILPVLSTTNNYDTYTTDLNVTYWTGDLIKSTKTTGSSSTTTLDWKASEQLPSWSNRKIQMANSKATELQDFTFSNLANRTFASINLQTNLDANKVNFLKGDTTNAGSYRTRTSLIGDIINSGPVLVGDAQYLSSAANIIEPSGDYAAFKKKNTACAAGTTSTADAPCRRAQVYVGANDGMLHAFDANSGAEKFAYIPTPVIPNLYWLADANYNSSSSSEHRYYVDGTPVVADVFFGNAWHTVLVGTLRGGGRGVFALDITDPDNISLLWEYTSDNDTDLGYTFSIPTISKLHDGSWVVLLGNGYGGNNGKASLLILNVDPSAKTRLISKLTPTSTGNVNNGLSSVRAADIDSDGIADYAYAGDLQGNVWRFDLTKGGAAASVSFGGSPLYSATVSADDATVQSITAPPSLIRHPSGTGFIVIFGTGRYFTTPDKTSTALQSVYGIWDQMSNTAPSLVRNDLLAQQIVLSTTATIGGVTQNIRTLTQNAMDWTKKSGWVLDLLVKGGSNDGERVTDEMFARGNLLLVPTRIPNQDPCSPGLTGWTYGIDPYSGGATTFNVFDMNRNGIIDNADQYKNTVISAVGNTAGGIALGNDQLATPDVDDPLRKVNFGPNSTGRQSWRMIPLATQ